MPTKQRIEQVLSKLHQIEYNTRTKNRKFRILAYLKDHAMQKFKPITISKAIGLESPTVRQQLRILLQEQMVIVDGFRQYQISNLGIEYYKQLVKEKKIMDIPPGS